MNHPPERFWDGVLHRLETETPSFHLEAWLSPLTASFENDRLRLACPTPFHRDRVRDRLLASIERHAAAEAGRPVAVELVVSPPLPGGSPAPPPRVPKKVERSAPRPAVAAEAASGPKPTPTPPEQAELPYRFDNFVVGSSNALAREASLAVAQGSQQRLNPLYLTAERGLGKTHLARAIAESTKSQGGRVIYASAEEFTNDFMASIRSQRMEEFKRRYRASCRLLVVEDVQFLENKKATQLELFHTILHVIDSGGRVVLTADRFPRDITRLDARLQSQMSAGLVAELETPDADLRRAILREKAAAGGIRLPEDCRELIVESTDGSVRDLEGVLIQLVASASLLKRPIDLALTRQALHKLRPVLPPRGIEPIEIVELVAAFFKTRPEVLAGKSRRRDVLWPRQIAMVLCRRYTDAPTAAIGRLLGREHTAVRNAVEVVERTLLESAPKRYQVEALGAKIDSLIAERRVAGR